jgi:hypothetical protein
MDLVHCPYGRVFVGMKRLVDERMGGSRLAPKD